MQSISIPAELFNAIGQYLATQPWGQVQPLMAGLEAAAREQKAADEAKAKQDGKGE